MEKKKKTKKKIDPGSRGYVLAEGEVTGHAHTVTKTKTVEMYEEEGGLKCLLANAPFEIEHEEHKTIKVNAPAKEKYTIGHVKEYDHFEEESKKLRD